MEITTEEPKSTSEEYEEHWAYVDKSTTMPEEDIYSTGTLILVMCVVLGVILSVVICILLFLIILGSLIACACGLTAVPSAYSDSLTRYDSLPLAISAY